LITLRTGDASGVVMRIKVLADIAMGVARPPHPVPDLDMGALQAAEKGVSRRHAILRPGLDYLYLIPLQSTNGTRINGRMIPTGMTVALHHGDVISLGALHLALGIEAAPEHLRE
jgi:pSer/pThr/pTyr-binding forkhead associated (FHA) protein